MWCWVPEGKWETGKIQLLSDDEAEILLSNGKVSFFFPCINSKTNYNYHCKFS